MKKLNCILLIDDDNASNFLHKKIISMSGITETIKVAEDGQEALDYLVNTSASSYRKPDLIFLDINMPVMDGWEFIEKYNTLSETLKANVILMMLSTSIDPEDKEKARQNGLVDDFLNKPLTLDMLTELMESKFN